MFKDSCSFSLRVAFEAIQRGVARSSSSSSSPQTSVCKGDTSQPWVTTVVWMCQWQLHGEAKEEKSRKKKANETEATCKANRGGKAALQLTYTEGASKKRSIIHNLKSNSEDASLHRGHCNMKAELWSRPHIHTNGGKKFSDALKMYWSQLLSSNICQRFFFWGGLHQGFTNKFKLLCCFLLMRQNKKNTFV